MRMNVYIKPYSRSLHNDDPLRYLGSVNVESYDRKGWRASIEAVHVLVAPEIPDRDNYCIGRANVDGIESYVVRPHPVRGAYLAERTQ